MAKRFEVKDCAGNTKFMTVDEFRAELAERKNHANKIMSAMVNGDLDGCTKAQTEMRERYAK